MLVWSTSLTSGDEMKWNAGEINPNFAKILTTRLKVRMGVTWGRKNMFALDQYISTPSWLYSREENWVLFPAVAVQQEIH